MASNDPISPADHYRRLERLYLEAPTNAYYRPSLQIEEGRAEIVIPVRAEHFHAADAVHGSIYFKVLDDAAFFAANSVVTDVFVLTSSFQLDLLRPVSEGEIRAEGHLVHRTRRLLIAESKAWDSQGNLIARGSGSFMRSQIRLDKLAARWEDSDA